MSDLPICCVTGRIAGDCFACGDCDPCSAANKVPDVVKSLLKERDEWADKYAGAMMELEDLRRPYPQDEQQTSSTIYMEYDDFGSL